MNNNQLVQHYREYGYKENRMINKLNFYEIYPDFNWKVYRYDNLHLHQLETEFDLIKYFWVCGRFQNKSINVPGIDQSLIPDVDSIRQRIKLLEDAGYNTPSMISKTDQEKLYELKSNTSCLIRLLMNIRFNIRTYRENEPSVTGMSDGQTIEYFLHHYFVKAFSWEDGARHHKHDLLRYTVHSIDVMKKLNDIFGVGFIYNKITKSLFSPPVKKKKYTLLVYTPKLEMWCGGIVSLYHSVKKINESDHPLFQAKVYCFLDDPFQNQFTDQFATLQDISEEETIVVYPETIRGNPLNAKFIIRWVLLELGFETPVNVAKTSWGANDLVYHWEPIVSKKQLSMPWINPVFMPGKNIIPVSKRRKTCFIFKKAILWYPDINRVKFHPEDSISMDGKLPQDVAPYLKECRHFYTYDVYTAFIYFAVMNGCVSIILPHPDKTEEEYLSNLKLNRNGKLNKPGIVIARHPQDKEWMRKEIERAEEDIRSGGAKEFMLTLFGDDGTLDEFLKDMEKYVETNPRSNKQSPFTNTVKCEYGETNPRSDNPRSDKQSPFQNTVEYR